MEIVTTIQLHYITLTVTVKYLHTYDTVVIFIWCHDDGGRGAFIIIAIIAAKKIRGI